MVLIVFNTSIIADMYGARQRFYVFEPLIGDWKSRKAMGRVGPELNSQKSPQPTNNKELNDITCQSVFGLFLTLQAGEGASSLRRRTASILAC